ncbi:serine/threonine protein kinase [Pseudomonas sp. LS44]|uniref:serine/threonine-protein kinase n=1 Tax=Pseudomonas sp. LS44 TaxID=1357074 RepID=UPI00215A8CF0|nr:serine/threonine-protein kinase [Pseudomonas sp. LS44]UVE17764.1 serine/threonine protein kinase [Pseudomonas sp. LS44]
MSLLQASTDGALREDESNLTYFAFAAGAVQKSALKAASQAVSELPDVLCGRYKIERLLGVGGMAAVYRARDLLREQFGDPEPFVALKTLSADFAEYPDANALLYTEFALISRLRHANVVQPYAFEIDATSQRAFITLELLGGCTLDQLLSEHPAELPWSTVREIAVPLLEALTHAHERGVLHGDLKPSNVMLGNQGVRLFDFGLGQAEEERLPGLPRLCRSRFTAWTPRYAAPELLAGGPLSAAADVYAMACVLYEVSCGIHPFRRLSAKQAKGMELKLQLPKRLPRVIANALRRGLDFDAKTRLSLSALLNAFRETPPSRPRRWFTGRA